MTAITVGVGIIFPYESNQELWGVFYRVINWTWALYILGAASLIMPKVLVNIRERRSLSATEKLSLSVFSGTTLIWLAYFTASFTSYIVGALSFTFVLYLSILLWVIAKNNKAENREKANPSYLANKIDQAKAAELQSKIKELMEHEQLYKNANLTLPQLAKRLHISVPLLSQFLNDNLQKSFATFINEWRIFEAKKLLIEAPRMTMEVVAEESGYNSQSTFYAAFKKIEKLTPAKYRQHELNAANVSPKL
ncbi:helix-turn-helix domain-containing protein [Brumicola blandensis]|uniref:Helix-turn-helix domain-containing protein n=1 Tax=Brumicola blandensis TaxID=3075611 RepID=A0AAW8QYP9_9ALTE|nr:helix-turn-helix domain-containing protein [Alteromonas sp. W409]MDT0581107.1 helix-turn-helix domain-containing protein [Alteromonas sp. W409]